jgi:hypothetical protein
MYLVVMDQLAREDIAAAAAAHHELGRDYDGAVAEGLIERIGDEIDKRVDARLGQRGDVPGQRDRHPQRDRLAQRDRDGQLSPAARPSSAVLILALGSMGLGVAAAGAVLSLAHGVASADWLVALIWIIIGVINVSYTRRH